MFRICFSRWCYGSVSCFSVLFFIKLILVFRCRQLKHSFGHRQIFATLRLEIQRCPDSCNRIQGFKKHSVAKLILDKRQCIVCNRSILLSICRNDTVRKLFFPVGSYGSSACILLPLSRLLSSPIWCWYGSFPKSTPQTWLRTISVVRATSSEITFLWSGASIPEKYMP